MSTYLIIGAGAIGSAVCEQLTEQGHEVRIMTRRGTGPAHASVQRIAASATDAGVVTRHARGTEAIINCANPAYHRWPTEWPPIANALLEAAEVSGSGLVTLSNLYAYGRPLAPMTPHDPLSADYEKAQVRATMWRDAKRAHDDGRIRATEVRASDFIGPRAQSYLGDRVVPRVLAGKGCRVLGKLDVVHSWNYTIDVARTLVVCSQNDQAWGRAWHVTANPPRSPREAINDIADVAGVAHVKIATIPKALLWTLGRFSPLLRELPKTLYQFEVPFIIDDSETRTIFDLVPTPWPAVLDATIASFRPANHPLRTG